jgi:YD repeat-containing protein
VLVLCVAPNPEPWIVTGVTWHVTDVTGAGCSSCSSRGNIHNDYDNQGNLLDRIDPLGHTTNYDNLSHLLSVLHKNSPTPTDLTHLGSSLPPQVPSQTFSGTQRVSSIRKPLCISTAPDIMIHRPVALSVRIPCVLTSQRISTLTWAMTQQISLTQPAWQNADPQVTKRD